MVEKIESILEGRADNDVNSYSINGRSLTKIPVTELMQFRAHYRAEYIKEQRKERAENSVGTGGTVHVRF